MLDIQFIRDNADLVAEKSQQKGYKVDIPKLLEADAERRALQQQVDELRAERNKHAEGLKQGKPTDEQIATGKEIKTKLSGLEESLAELDKNYVAALRGIPNISDDDSPIGGEEDSVEIKKVGDQKTGAKDHLDLAIAKDWVDFERGAKVAGKKFYFLKGDLALLENAITQFALDFILKNDFTFMTVPHLVSPRIAAGTGYEPKGEDDNDQYITLGGEFVLVGTSEMSLTGYHADEIIEEEKLPLMYAGISPCYRKEAGTYGKHARGLFRVHQFNKLEMYVYSLPEQSKQIHEKLLALEEEVWQAIGIPYHIINIATGDLGAPAAKKYDLEYWSPVDGSYRELTSCSNCTDYQARNLNIRVRRKDGSIETVHTLNGTVVSLARSLVAVIENFQDENGNVVIPEVLRPYMGGKEQI